MLLKSEVAVVFIYDQPHEVQFSVLGIIITEQISDNIGQKDHAT